MKVFWVLRGPEGVRTGPLGFGGFSSGQERSSGYLEVLQWSCSGKERFSVYYEILRGSEEVLQVLGGPALATEGPLDIWRSGNGQERFCGY